MELVSRSHTVRNTVNIKFGYLNSWSTGFLLWTRTLVKFLFVSKLWAM